MLTIVKKTFQYPVNLLQVTLIVFAFAYLFVAVFMKVLLDHNFMISDVAGYWQDSLHWREPFHPFHVPGYPLAIAFIRGITGGVIEPVVIMMLLNILALIGCLYFVYKITSRMSGSDGIALAATILFGLWPLVGLTYTVVPLADIPTLLLYLAALYYLQKDNWVVSSILFGLSMITHKAIWPYVGLTIVFHLIKQGNLFTRKAFLQSILVALPLGLLWISGSIYHQSFTWILSSNLDAELSSRGTLPILDGVIGTFLSGEPTDIIKGLILVFFFTISIAVFIFSARLKGISKHWGFAISLATILWFVVLNQHEIWAAIRFSRLLVIPLAAFVTINLKQEVWTSKRYVLGTIFVITLFLSQLAYAWYIVRVFYA